MINHVLRVYLFFKFMNRVIEVIAQALEFKICYSELAQQQQSILILFAGYQQGQNCNGVLSHLCKFAENHQNFYENSYLQNQLFLIQIISMISNEQEQVKIDQISIRQRYVASMVLAAVGDAIGYRGGKWQFNYNGENIHKELMVLSNQQGIQGLIVDKDAFPYSDDTVMHIATAKGLLEAFPDSSLDLICTNVARHYKQCMKQMSGRAPGMTCIRSAKLLRNDGSNWRDLPFSSAGGGCGASMRAACIGLYFYNNMDKLIEVSIETGRTTHHNPLGYLGSFVAALFTAFSIQNIPSNEWLYLLLKQYLPKAKYYVARNRQAEENIQGGDWDKFQVHWKNYASARKMKINEPSEPMFPEVYGVRQREDFYHQFSINGWPGALGLDSVVIAYDALLSSLEYCRRRKSIEKQANKWQQICLRGMLHGGDSDSTGTIVGAWYGALYGFYDVYLSNHAKLQQRELIASLGNAIYEKIHHQPKQKHEERV